MNLKIEIYKRLKSIIKRLILPCIFLCIYVVSGADQSVVQRLNVDVKQIEQSWTHTDHTKN